MHAIDNFYFLLGMKLNVHRLTNYFLMGYLCTMYMYICPLPPKLYYIPDYNMQWVC